MREYPELEGTLKDHQIQPLATTKIQTIFLTALSKHFFNSSRLSVMTWISLGGFLHYHFVQLRSLKLVFHLSPLSGW